ILVTEGYVKREAGGRGAVVHRLITPFSEPISGSDRHANSDNNTDLVPPSPPRPHRVPDGEAAASDCVAVLGSRHAARPTGTRSASGTHDEVESAEVAPDEIKTINGQRVNIRTGEVLDQ